LQATVNYAAATKHQLVIWIWQVSNFPYPSNASRKRRIAAIFERFSRAMSIWAPWR